MRNIVFVAAFATLAAGLCVPAVADSHEEEGGPVVFPIEGHICSYVEGAGPGDLNAWIEDWSAWADGAGITEYWAATLVPYYYSANQEFDLIWLGASMSATSLGRAQDKWVAEGAELRSSLAKVVECSSHLNFAAMGFRPPPDKGSPDSFVMSMSDCKMADGVNFDDDLAPALAEWAQYGSDHGLTGPIWAWFPAYGGGGEEFDFKYVTGHRNLEAQGANWDAYAAGGYEKAEELFAGKVDCDSSRVYLGTTRRRPPMEE